MKSILPSASCCCATTILLFQWLTSSTLLVADDVVNYQKQVRHVLQDRCFACHGSLKQESGLRVDTAAAAIKGGEGGAAIVPGDSVASELVKRILSNDLATRMPPEGEALKPEEIASIRRWIDEGAMAPADETPESDPREHWSFRKPIRPIVPNVHNPEWVLTPVDAFVAKSHALHNLTPQPAAAKLVWLRRVHLDLVGLPPTRDQQTAFLSDESADAFDKVVNQLFGNPQYGERWGRHWMDIWRYSDWWGLGAEVRNSQKHIWHWRDWIVESLNDNKPYDQMLREMLAADELYPNDMDRLRASGFLARQYFKFNRTSWLDETVEHTSKAMLGLTMNCCKCHDHKYDPLSQVEYYQMRAFFEPYQVRTDVVLGEVDFEKDGIPRPFDCNLDVVTHLHIRGDDRNPDKGRVISPLVPAFLSTASFSIEPVSLPLEASQPWLRSFVQETFLRNADKRIATATAERDAAMTRLMESEASSNEPTSEGRLPLDQAKLALTVAEKNLLAAIAEKSSLQTRAAAQRATLLQPDDVATAALVASAVLAEREAKIAASDLNVARAELVVLQASVEKKTESETKLKESQAILEADRKLLEMPSDTFTPLIGALKTLESNLETEDSRRKPFPQTSTGRRTALAKWITDPQNPLPARVAVNHIWARHFGKGIVTTLFDFGRKGAQPTHPELLDWLAVEFVENGWDMKHIQRLIVLSNTYRMSSSILGASDGQIALDGDNQFYWRRNPVRMESQLVRDSLLSLAGELDLTLGGPSIPVSDEASRRRSLYFVHSHNEHQKFLSMFDDASVLECYRRADSIVPQQALALENSSLASEMAAKISGRVQARFPDCSDEDFVREAYLMVLSVEPAGDEIATMVQALSDFAAAASAAQRPEPRALARQNLIQALVNHNDFVTVR